MDIAYPVLGLLPLGALTLSVLEAAPDVTELVSLKVSELVSLDALELVSLEVEVSELVLLDAPEFVSLEVLPPFVFPPLGSDGAGLS